MTVSLFLDHKLTFTKVAMPVKLSDSPEVWQREIASEVFKQVPFLGDYAVNVIVDRVDAEKGFAFGSAQITNKSQAPAGDQEKLPTLRIPIIVKERMLAPFDVFMDGKGVYPLTEKRVREKLFRTSTFEPSVRKPSDKGLTDQLYPPMRTNYGMGSLGSDTMGMGKMAEDAEAYENPLRGKPLFNTPKSRVYHLLADKAAPLVDQLMDQTKTAGALPAEQARRAYISRMHSEAAANPNMNGMAKGSSLLDAISDTIQETDADEFVDQIAEDKELRNAAAANPTFSEMAMKVAQAPTLALQKTAEAIVDRIKPTVVQIQKLASGNFKVKWANSGAFMPQEGEVGPEQASQMTGHDVGGMQPGATATLGTQKPMTPPTPGGYVPVTEAGVYKVQSMETNEEMVGHVFPVVDMSEQPMGLFLFIGEQGYAVQEEIAGSPVQDEVPPPQTTHLSEAQGEGAVLCDVNGVSSALLPVVVHAQGQDPSGGVQLHAENMFGEPVSLSISPGLQEIHQLSDDEYALPDTVHWCPLQGEPLFLAKQPLDVEQIQEAKASPASVNVASTGNDDFSLQGQPLDKVAKEQKQFLKHAEAEFLLVGMGLNQFQARDVLRRSQEQGLVKVGGMLPIVPLAHVHKQMVKRAAKSLAGFPYHLKKNLVKEAAALEDGETADKVLSLNFLNPDNINTFANYLPELDSASQKLAETLVASRLGMSQVDEGAIERSMRGMESVIEGLRSLQQGEAS
jgi:hypothetical protein